MLFDGVLEPGHEPWIPISAARIPGNGFALRRADAGRYAV